MEMKWLEDFICVADSGSFSRSAEQRNITQSALSRRIKALELWLGVALVDRSTYPTQLTAAGRAFRDRALSMLQQAHEAREEFRQYKQNAEEIIRFSALHTLSLTFFPVWLRRVEECLGPLKTTLVADNMHDCVQALATGSVDFLLAYAHDQVPILLDAQSHPSVSLAQEEIVPVSIPTQSGHAQFSLPGRPSEPLPFLAYSSDTFLGRIVQFAIAKNLKRHHLSIVYENSMAEALKAMALQGRGLAWLPASSVKREIEDGHLVLAGGTDWAQQVEVRIYRTRELVRPRAEQLWGYITSSDDCRKRSVGPTCAPKRTRTNISTR